MAEQNLMCAYSGLPSMASYMLAQAEEENRKNVGNNKVFDAAEQDRIIQMAWEDRTPFEAIEYQFGLKEKDVIEFMRKNSIASSFRMWRKRMKSRKTKHLALRGDGVERFKCSRQRSTGNKISKR